jgi:hypothetical protein
MTTGSLTIADLERWILFGAECRIVAPSGERAIVDLCTCTASSSSGGCPRTPR